MAVVDEDINTELRGYGAHLRRGQGRADAEEAQDQPPCRDRRASDADEPGAGEDDEDRKRGPRRNTEVYRTRPRTRSRTRD